jgi:hypothetical protein
MREMREMKKYFLLPLLLLPLLTLPLATYAHSYPVTKQLKQSVNIPKKGLPGRRENGGTRRESCMSGELPQLAVAVTPTNIGLTSTAYPRFFWYTPKNTAQKVKFILHKVDETGQRTLVYVLATPLIPPY